MPVEVRGVLRAADEVSRWLVATVGLSKADADSVAASLPKAPDDGGNGDKQVTGSDFFKAFGAAPNTPDADGVTEPQTLLHDVSPRDGTLATQELLDAATGGGSVTTMDRNGDGKVSRKAFHRKALHFSLVTRTGTAPSRVRRRRCSLWRRMKMGWKGELGRGCGQVCPACIDATLPSFHPLGMDSQCRSWATHRQLHESDTTTGKTLGLQVCHAQRGIPSRTGT